MNESRTHLVRRADADDLAGLLELRIGMGREIGGSLEPEREAAHRERVRAYLAAELGSESFAAFVAAEPDGRLLATASVRVVHRAPHPRSRRLGEAQVTGVYTIPAERGRGLAREVVTACLDQARTWRVRRAWLRTSAAGRRVYEGLGFTDLGNYLQLDLD